MEDGIPFCPRCNAPQIHVANTSASEPATASFPPGTPESIHPAGQRLFGIEWKHMRRRALPIAAALALLMLSTPDLFWAWLPAAGALVVWLHRLRTSEIVSTRAGLRIGAFTGAVAFAIFGAVLASIVFYDRLVMHRTDRLTEGSRRQLEEYAKSSSDPQVQDRVRKILESPDGVTTYIMVGIPILFLLFLTLCATGGALSAAMSGRRSGP